jgi:fumarylacetoacetate (FAA) hydrolase family protein
MKLSAESCLPSDGTAGTLVGRAWIPGDPPGPALVTVRADGLWDISDAASTMSELLNAADPVRRVRGTPGKMLGDLNRMLANSAAAARHPALPFLLAPCDLQAVKAAGVTFATSLLERVIEEQARGDAAKAENIRHSIAEIIGTDLASLKPGSAEALRVKEVLVARGAWSQYLEVGIGPDAEVFTKCQPLAAVGLGAEIGIHPASTWNNPEPEVVLAVNAAGAIVGAALGNDVNLRDVEGRSALLLGKAKDNNASTAIGPFIRLIDPTFGIDDIRQAEVRLEVAGEDGFRLAGASSLSKISRDVTDLVKQTIGPNHQYPDGFMLFTGTMFAPVEDRYQKGSGFTHAVGDIVTIASPKLGALTNQVNHCDKIEPWSFGAGALMQNLAARGLLRGRENR